VIRRLPEPRNLRKVFGQEQRECFEIDPADDAGLRAILGIPGIPGLLVIYFLVMLGFSFFCVGRPIHAVQALRWSVTDTGAFFAYLSLGFGALFWGSFVAIYTSATLIAVGNGLMWPSVMSLLSKAAGTAHQGAVQGFGASLGAVASIAGLIAAGVLYDVLGAQVFVVAGSIILPVSLIAPHCARVSA